ncbi:MAG: hypothetical protein ACYTGL_26975 [Planctomycetota bacterium]|jgi:hypothetical protein
MDAQVSRKLKQVIRRTRYAQLLRNLSWLWSLLALAACLAWYVSPAGMDGATIVQVLSFIALPGTVWILRPRVLSEKETQDVARSIEARYPDLQQRLLTAIDQKPNPDTGHFTWLQNVLASEVRSHAYVYDWRKARPLPGLLLRAANALCAVAVSMWLAMQLWDIEPTALADTSPVEEPEQSEIGSPFQLTVDPGNAEVERGSSLLILARFDGPLPAEVSLKRTTVDGESSLPMAKALDDPLFGIRLPSVTGDFEYTVRYDDETSEQFRIAVYELPRIEQIDATVEFPSYANLPNETIEDTWQVAAVEGSTVVLTCRLNKPIADGALFSDRGDEFPLVRVSESEAVTPSDSEESTAVSQPSFRYAARIPVTQSLNLEIAVEDNHGRPNREEDEFRIDALPNKPPEIKLTFPARDLRVSPVEELHLEANVWDDFGLRELGLELAVADQPTKTITLAEKAAGREMHQLAHLVQLELENAEPDQLVSYYFFADDFDSAGEPRRTMSDMFFAEVRHFEEIFREGRQPPAGQQQQQQQQQSQNAQQAEQLADLQKQIMNATWKIIRRETREEVSSSFAEDTGALIESQQEALAQLSKMAEQVRDPVSKGHVTNVAKAMTSAVDRLTTARTDADADILDEALKHERSAYQGLLKLRAREHEVTQQQQQQSQSRSQQRQNRSQQQLDQLELDNKKNRYEAERQAQQQENQQQQNQEQLQVLNRLRELARRQGDLNQKLRELELALKAAEDKNEQEEIERQLKRLREEQRELLRDFDELRNRMEQPENQQQLAQESQKLNDTRDRVRQASEALEKGQVSQALNQGTRAERELEQLRDDVRQKAAGQFGDAMRDLRQQAREIGERQDQIAQQLKGDDKKQEGGRPSLRKKQERTDLRDEFRDQRKQLEQVVDRMRDVVEKAETAEPLLARQLYETVRNARSDRTDEALEQADMLLQRGFVKEAAETEEFAHKGVERLQQGIEKAADSVLGNELETLKRASRELADARDAIADELGEKTGERGQQAEGQSGQSQDQQTEAGRQDGQPQPGQRRQDGASNGQQTDQKGEQRDRQQQASAQQPGQQPQGQSGQQQKQTGQQKSGQPGEQGAKRPGQQPSDKQNGQQSQQQGQQPRGDSPQQGQQPNGQQSGKQNGQKPGQQPGQGQQPNGQSPSSQQQQNGQPANSLQPGQRPGQQPGGERQSQQSQSGQQQSGQQRGNRQRPGLRNSQQAQQQEGRGGLRTDSAEHNSQGAPPGAPLTGGDFVEWSDQLRNIEELVDDPKLRAEVARIREAARNMRVEFKRHSKEPEWSLVRMQILEPLSELRKQLQEEIARRESPDSLVPIDRDPIPEKYSDLVRQYYERIGAGRVLTPETEQQE